MRRLDSPKSVLNDPAGCVLTDVPDRTPGSGCAVGDSSSATGSARTGGRRAVTAR
jgi:hypothetical protein